MDAIKTNYKYNFDKAENDTFLWSSFDGTNGNSLTHKPTGRQIYQMTWMDDKKSVSDDIKQEAITFWSELATLQSQKPPKKASTHKIEEEPKHGENGYCRKCHSYCYGDCDANRS